MRVRVRLTINTNDFYGAEETLRAYQKQWYPEETFGQFLRREFEECAHGGVTHWIEDIQQESK